MLSLLEVQISNGSVLRMPFFQEEEGVLVREVTGLDPVSASLTTSTYASRDGADYHGGRRGVRNILIKLSLSATATGGSVSSLRRRLYSYLVPKTEVELLFYDTSGETFKTYGIVESVESPTFTSEPSMAISILCPDPDFLSPDPTTYQAPNGTLTVNYDGTSPSGFELEIRPYVDYTTLDILIDNDNGSFSAVGHIYGSETGARFYFLNTVPGERSFRYVSGNYSRSRIYMVTPQSHWPMLMPGTNSIELLLDGSHHAFSIDAHTRYGGL